MQFTYNEKAGENQLVIEGESYKHLFKSRRSSKDEVLYFRNLEDDFIYAYKIVSLDKRSALLTFETKEEKIIKHNTHLHIGWCIIDPKEIEKTLPALNELGVESITFIYCDKSQKQFKLDEERIKRILINSSQQCGRSNIIKIFHEKNIDNFYKQYPESKLIDFGGTDLIISNDNYYIIGAEGGLSERERKLVSSHVGLQTPNILRSTTATTAIASKILS